MPHWPMLLILIAIAVLVVLFAWMAWIVRPSARMRQRYRQALFAWNQELSLAQQWQNLWGMANRVPDCGIAWVERVYGFYPEKGVKADLRWWRKATYSLPSGFLQDAWFESEWPTQGMWVAVTGSTAYGRHSDNPETFYIDSRRGGALLGHAPFGADVAFRHCASTNWQPPPLPKGITVESVMRLSVTNHRATVGFFFSLISYIGVWLSASYGAPWRRDLCFLAGLLLVESFILSSMGLAHSRIMGEKRKGRGLAIAGLIFAGLTMVPFAFMIVLLVSLPGH